jgi:hypothetical protein
LCDEKKKFFASGDENVDKFDATLDVIRMEEVYHFNTVSIEAILE